MPISLKQVYSPVNGYKNKFVATTSQSFTVPANVYMIDIYLTGGGGGGGGFDNASSKQQGSGGGSAGSTAWLRNLPVQPNDVITIIIGAGGNGVAEQVGQNGGTTVVYKNYVPLGRASGGIGGTIGAAAGIGGVNVNFQNTWSVTGDIAFVGGNGGNGGNSVGFAPSGTIVSAKSSIVDKTQVFTSAFTEISVNNGGSGAGSTFYGGGGGGCSYYGVGGTGGNGPISGGTATQGGDAAAYGAGGGGCSGSSGSAVRGGHGKAGVVEVYY